MDNADPTRRFSDRAAYYVRYRPGYPEGVVELLQRETGLTRDSVVADIGSGTGISSEMLLPHARLVYAVEPNAEMRASAEMLLGENPNFRSVDGTAESTGLPDASVDLITAATAFHWFDPTRTRPEFQRILKPGAFLVLLWNTRRSGDNGFGDAYEALLKEFAVDYEKGRLLQRQQTSAGVAAFFGELPFRLEVLDNVQTLDEDGLTGRILSASYMPLPGHPRYNEMLAAIAGLYRRFQVDGFVQFPYDTNVYWGRLVAS
ncbi:MAG: class I SAM-dependent methyltransferase [Bryobacteraceae bacterium]|nr:class I SAM-dependent methyltransferase [Bryobacteraceae bacterium]